MESFSNFDVTIIGNTIYIDDTRELKGKYNGIRITTRMELGIRHVAGLISDLQRLSWIPIEKELPAGTGFCYVHHESVDASSIVNCKDGVFDETKHPITHWQYIPYPTGPNYEPPW